MTTITFSVPCTEASAGASLSPYTIRSPFDKHLALLARDVGSLPGLGRRRLCPLLFPPRFLLLPFQWADGLNTEREEPT